MLLLLELLAQVPVLVPVLLLLVEELALLVVVMVFLRNISNFDTIFYLDHVNANANAA